MGIRSVAVYSALTPARGNVREADVAYASAPPTPESYLSVERLLEAAAATGAQAVHARLRVPVREHPPSRRRARTPALVFVGPPVRAVEVMGDKIRAKQTVSAAGVPVVPGRAEPGLTDADLLAAAEAGRLPGAGQALGGRGRQGDAAVTEPGALAEALRSARREAASSFGDDTLFLERFVTRPRHLEVQVLADTAGTTVHLGERECSLQRRHQKVVEEAPSVLLDEAARRASAAPPSTPPARSATPAPARRSSSSRPTLPRSSSSWR
jgi:acetyl-CoA/propionyl-CoA carboxylase biotin carboxyl carrier protein